MNVVRHEPTIRAYGRDEIQGLPAAQNLLIEEHLRRPLLADDGNTTFLIAWIGPNPVGHLNLKWHGNKEPEVRAYVVDTPELNGISVWPPDMQSQSCETDDASAGDMVFALDLEAPGLGGD